MPLSRRNSLSLRRGYERKYVEEIKLQEEEQTKSDKVEQTLVVGQEVVGGNLKSKSSSAAEQDLDSFLLGDLEDSDAHPVGAEGDVDRIELLLSQLKGKDITTGRREKLASRISSIWWWWWCCCSICRAKKEEKVEEKEEFDDLKMI